MLNAPSSEPKPKPQNSGQTGGFEREAKFGLRKISRDGSLSDSSNVTGQLDDIRSSNNDRREGGDDEDPKQLGRNPW